MMDRRSFLRGAAVVGSGVLTAGVVAGCSSPSPQRGRGQGTTTIDRAQRRPAGLADAGRFAPGHLAATR